MIRTWLGPTCLFVFALCLSGLLLWHIGANVREVSLSFGLAKETRSRVAGLEERLERLDGSVGDLSQGAASIAMQAQDERQAIDRLQAAIQNAFNPSQINSGSYQVVGEGVVEARVSWQGSEGNWRRAMEQIAHELPGARFSAMRLQARPAEGRSAIEVTFELKLAWSSAP